MLSNYNKKLSIDEIILAIIIGCFAIGASVLLSHNPSTDQASILTFRNHPLYRYYGWPQSFLEWSTGPIITMIGATNPYGLRLLYSGLALDIVFYFAISLLLLVLLKPQPQAKLWFKNKIYGWGWYPASWQGWVTIIVYVVALYITFWDFGWAFYSGSDRVINLSPWILFLTIVLILVCYHTGEPLSWRWGKENKK